MMTRRLRRSAVLLTSLVLAALVAAGCGGSEEPSKAARTDPAPAATGTGIDAELRIELSQIGSTKVGAGDAPGTGVPVPSRLACSRSIPATCSGTLTCERGGEARSDDRCEWLASSGATLLAGAGDDSGAQACTQQFGGPERGTVTGTIDGERVDVELSRTDGCEIGRWDDLSTLWNGPQPTSSADGAGGSGAAAGQCLAQEPGGSTPTTGAPASGGSLADDTSCSAPAGTPAPPVGEPEIISDPPSAFQ